MTTEIYLPSQVRGTHPSLLQTDDGVMLDADIHLVTPGETITADPQFMKGHGAYSEALTTLVSAVGGVVERTNKLVTVRALRTRYAGFQGDIVVGRVVDVGSKQWRVDVAARQDAQLALSSIHLPGNIQRRKSASDELAMRTFFQEGELMVAEVQKITADGLIQLQTRSTKYGKLRNGSLVVVPPSLIMRCKSHFQSLPCGVDVVLGLNGYVWVYQPTATAGDHAAADEPTNTMTGKVVDDVEAELMYSSKNDVISRIVRENIARVANCIRALARCDVGISDAMINYAYESSLAHEKVSDLLRADVVREIAEQARTLYEMSLE
ncbi:hypothetical protein BC828DRAFT_389683 [Blastocladiella britannica]|nr:hypothetical protein BC828DRAFT_389683 [Blastocladiella britannica]